jgi:NADH-quinone oxidoreductase subunit C
VSDNQVQVTGGGAESAARTGTVIAQRHGAFGASGAGDVTGFGGFAEQVTMPGPSSRPYGGYFDEVVDSLTQALEAKAPTAIEKVVVDRGELTVYVRREDLVAVMMALRDEPALRFELSLGVTGVNYPLDKGRELHALYHLTSLTHGGRNIRVETTCPDADPHIPSTVSVYPANDWHEREAWDMFGIVFDGHPGLARILMPDDWVGHPQRKDYPLGGIGVQFKGATTPPVAERRRYF